MSLVDTTRWPPDVRVCGNSNEEWRSLTSIATEYIPHLDAFATSYAGKPLVLSTSTGQRVDLVQNPHFPAATAVVVLPISGMVVTAGRGSVTLWDRDFTRVLVEELVACDDDYICLAATHTDRLLIG